MKIIDREKMIVRKSFRLPFRNMEIWSEELDALSVYTDVVREKFLEDMKIINRPSSPSLIAVHLNETLVDEEIAGLITSELSKAGKNVRKVAFVGLNFSARRMFKAQLENCGAEFIYNFLNDYEAAKEWLAS